MAALLLIAVTAIISIKYKRSPGPLRSGISSDSSADWSLKVNKGEQGWMYEIYSDSTLFIEQKYIPAIHGNIPFKNEEDARACGNLAIQKLQNKHFPAISRNELDSLGIEY